MNGMTVLLIIGMILATSTIVECAWILSSPSLRRGGVSDLLVMGVLTVRCVYLGLEIGRIKAGLTGAGDPFPGFMEGLMVFCCMSVLLAIRLATRGDGRNR